MNLDPSTRRTLAELASILNGEADAENAKNIIISKLQQLDRPCLTVGCTHGPTFASLCNAYSVQGEIYGIEGGALHVTHQTLSPLVQPDVCCLFPRLKDESKAACRDCSDHEYASRVEFNGAFCHGCGLFIDFKNRRVGYVKEWTTSYDLTSEQAPEAKECMNCGSTVITAKLGDYVFCSRKCLQDWYSSNIRSL